MSALERLARTQVAYQFDNFTYLRSIVQWDTENHDREFSLLAASVLNYGTQVHAGVEFRAADALFAAQPASSGARHWATFVRVSYLLRR